MSKRKPSGSDRRIAAVRSRGARIAALALLLALLALCLFSIAGCGGAEEEKPGLTLGVIADLAGQTEGRPAGEAPSDDLAFYYGAQHAVNGAIAASDGTLRFRLLTGDLAGDPGSIREVYDALVEEGADAILCLSKYAEEIQDAAALAGIPLMVPDGGGTLSSAAPGEAGQSGLFTLRPDPVYYGRAAAFFMRISSFRTVSLAVDREDGYALAAADAFADAAASYGIKVLGREEFSSGDPNSVTQAAEALQQAGKANGYFVACAFPKVIETAGSTLWQGGLYSGTWVLYADGSDYEGLFDGEKDSGREETESETPYYLSQALCISTYNRRMKKIPRADTAVRFKELYGFDLNAAAFWGYEGASALLQTAENLGDGDRTVLWESGLRGSAYLGINGSEFYFTENGYTERGLSVVKFAAGEDGKLNDSLRIEEFRPKEIESADGAVEKGE